MSKNPLCQLACFALALFMVVITSMASQAQASLGSDTGFHKSHALNGPPLVVMEDEEPLPSTGDELDDSGMPID
jgi:hypothetical protein